MSDSSGSVVPLVGRILISVVFILGGIGKIAAFGMYSGIVAAGHLPLPQISLIIAIIIELLGGLAILTGFYARLTAWVVFLYLIPTTLLFHNFWAYQGAERMNNIVNFQKNLAIMGGLLLLAAYGAGAYSFDAARRSKA
jgi:putative oxidoreductase